MRHSILILLLCVTACGSEPAQLGPDAGTPDTSLDSAIDTGDADAAARPDSDVTTGPDATPTDARNTDASPGECPDPDDPRVSYVSRDPVECAETDFDCFAMGWSAFDDPECGCGCVASDNMCPDPDAPGVQYVAASPDDCAAVFFDCDEGFTSFEGGCGCGCVESPRICLDRDEPGVTYIGNSPEQCAAIDYFCEEGAEYFGNVCGCGCIVFPSLECPDPEAPLAQYFSDDAELCAVTDWDAGCEEGGDWFENECGCGCLYGPPECPNPDDPSVEYVGHSPDDCADIDFDCGEDFFDAPCGCGCITPSLTCPDEEDPRVSYAGESPEECALIDFGCPDSWDHFGSDCGCGCDATRTLACDFEKFTDTSGLAEPFGLYAGCEFLVACSDGPTPALTEAFEARFPDARCASGSGFGCPLDATSTCEVFIGEVDAAEVAAACDLSTVSAVSSLLCGGDF